MDLNDLKDRKPRRPLIFYYLIVLGVLLLLNFFVVPFMNQRSIQETTYDQFLDAVNAGEVDQVQLDSNVIYYTVEQNGREQICKTGRIYDMQEVQRLYGKVSFGQVIPTETSPIVSFLISWILPIVLIIVIGQFISRKMAKSMGGGPGAMMFGKSNAKVYVKSSTGIKFSDVAGEDEAKELLTEIVDYLHNPHKYQ